MDATPYYFTDKDAQFHDLFFEYMELVAEGLYSSDKSTDVWNMLTELLYESEVSPAAFIHCASEIFRKYPYREFALLGIFEGLIWSRGDQSHLYSYPELLWIVIRENILNDLSTTDHIFDLAIRFSHT